MATHPPHSDETRAAVLSALLAGQSVSEVARQYKVTPQTIRVWRAAAGPPMVSQEKRQDIGELVIDYLRASLTTLTAQQAFFRDTAWLRKQDAAELAALHGIIADKAFRILAALEDNPEDAGAAADDDVDPAD